MPDPITVKIDGQSHTVSPYETVAAAILNRHGLLPMRRSISGEPRSVLCGMGICFECRVSIDGRADQRSCNRMCADGMEIRTADA